MAVVPHFELSRELDAEAARLFERFRAAGQEHLFGFWNALDDQRRAQLVAKLRRMDLAQVAALTALIAADAPAQLSRYRPPVTVEPPAAPFDPASPHPAIMQGQRLLQAGKVAVLLVAGGQASRLGIDKPKGCLEFGPVTGRSLFELFALQIAAGIERYGTQIPWLVMTSEATHAETVAFFERHDAFGLDPNFVRFFQQGMLPALDERGRILLASEDTPFLSPDGHGGVLAALKSHGLVEWMRGLGVETVSYFQVDNPQCRILDPLFLGLHREAQAEFSVKVVPKEEPSEKVGLVIQRSDDGHHDLIEYSVLSEKDAHKRDADGRLTYRAGNTAIHAIELAFIERLLDERGMQLPMHVAHKQVPHLDVAAAARGEAVRVSPASPNGYKFEQFIFDAMPLAQHCVVLAVHRDAEFLPIKSAEGPTSPEAVTRAYQQYWARTLRQLGAELDGASAAPLEVHPRFLLEGAPHPALAAHLAAHPPASAASHLPTLIA